MLEEEARRQNLPGSDVFIRTQLAYKTELNRDALIVHLNREAYKAFIDTVTIGQYPQLRQEAEMLKKDVQFLAHAHATVRRGEYLDLDNFKIAAGFELHLKACLVARNIVIHLITKLPSFAHLRKKQQKAPVYKDELLAIEGFYYTGELNVLRGLTSKSLDFDTILNPQAYRQQLGKSQEFLEIVEDYRNLRNQIHMPGDIVEAPHINRYQGDSLMRLLVQFINDEIVEYSNKLIDTWKLNPAGKLRRLPYFN